MTTDIPPSLYESENLARAELFQYLVGNTDFTFFSSVNECCHNGKVFLIPESARGYLLVPHYFDLSGLVNTPYAKPNPTLKIRSVRTRIYRGIEHSEKVFERTIQHILERNDAVYALWENFHPLPEQHCQKALKYLDQFYETISDSKRMSKHVIQSMRSLERLNDLIQRGISDHQKKEEK